MSFSIPNIQEIYRKTVVRISLLFTIRPFPRIFARHRGKFSRKWWWVLEGAGMFKLNKMIVYHLI
jgi:hypothetical protein